jgi:hypothetical protein
MVASEERASVLNATCTERPGSGERIDGSQLRVEKLVKCTGYVIE